MVKKPPQSADDMNSFMPGEWVVGFLEGRYGGSVTEGGVIII
jgi:hypothetical protein